MNGTKESLKIFLNKTNIMDSIQCFNCSKTLTAVVLFCPFCLIQIKCKNCKTVLIKDGAGCTECGTSIINKGSFTNNSVNQIEFEQKGDMKKFKATFSDEVSHTLVETFGAFVVGGNLQLRKKTNPFSNRGELPNTTSPKQTVQAEEIDFEENDITEELAKLFREQDGALSLMNPRLKQTSKLDNAIRIAILTLYAYEQMGKTEIDRKALSTVLKSSKLNIPVFSTWINKCDEILKNGSKLQLSVPGKAIAIEILKEIADPNVTKGEIQFSKTSSGGGAKKKSVKNSENEKSSGESGSPKNTSGTGGQSYSILPDLNLIPPGKTSLKDFFTPYKSKNHSEHILIIVYYLKNTLNDTAINVNSIYSCYKHLHLKVPNIPQALNNIKTRNGWINTSDWNSLKTSVGGDNHLEHDLVKRKEADKNGSGK